MKKQTSGSGHQHASFSQITLLTQVCPVIDKTPKLKYNTGMLAKIPVKTTERTQFIDITERLQSLVNKEKLNKGILQVYCPHTTAAITINENADPSVQRDIIHALGKVVPYNDHYQHSEGNADAHVKASLIGSSETLLVENTTIALGTWQGVYFCEFDGPRSREVWVKLITD
jgi:secondary thiamine-phosphate synthase enzyme